MTGDFDGRYHDIESGFRKQAAQDGCVYLPNPAPKGPVDYLLVAMEPSLQFWASSPAEADQRIHDGFRNFLWSPEDLLFHFAIRSYLCWSGENYHLTDMSKGAMPVEKAGMDREARWKRWLPLLKEEIHHVGPSARLIAVGNKVSEFLADNDVVHQNRVIHYSRQAGAARKIVPGMHREEFGRFAANVDAVAVEQLAGRLMEEAGVQRSVRDAAPMTRLKRDWLTLSRKELLFTYKHGFNAMRTARP